MTGIPRTGTSSRARQEQRRRDRRAAELEAIRANPPAKVRRCPVCGSAPGPGFNTYCSTDHMLYRAPRKARKAS